MKTHLISTLFALSSFATSLHAQGSLNPPPGAPGATMKTLTEVEPRTAINAANTPGTSGGNGNFGAEYIISNPGSYYLTGNVTAAANHHGIWVQADNVTIDLNGFTISGVSSSGDGINLSGHSQITVRNGIITGCRLGLDNNSGTDCRYENLTVSACREIGIRSGNRCVIQNCTVRSNSGHGIWVISDNIIRSCLVWGNGIIGNMTGIEGWDRCVVENCLANENYGSGIKVQENCRITGCTAQKNKSSGIVTGLTGDVTDCLCHENTVNGITVNEMTTVRRCHTNKNGNSGISLRDDGCASDNTCHANGYAGIQVNADQCRIERNEAWANQYGIAINNGKVGNFVALNRCTGNSVSNFSVPANSTLAPVLTSPSFTGATAWSNFAF